MISTRISVQNHEKYAQLRIFEDITCSMHYYGTSLMFFFFRLENRTHYVEQTKYQSVKTILGVSLLEKIVLTEI